MVRPGVGARDLTGRWSLGSGHPECRRILDADDPGSRRRRNAPVYVAGFVRFEGRLLTGRPEPGRHDRGRPQRPPGLRRDANREPGAVAPIELEVYFASML